jgi:hypothetical protein
MRNWYSSPHSPNLTLSFLIQYGRVLAATRREYPSGFDMYIQEAGASGMGRNLLK